MRIVGLATAIVLCAGVVLHAQDEDVLRPHGKPGGDGGTASSSKKKSSWIIGPELGLNFNFSGRDIQGTNPNAPVNVFESTSGVSPFVGLYLETPIAKSMHLGCRFLYDMKSMGATDGDSRQECTTETGVTVVTTETELVETVNYFTINPVIRFDIVDRFFVHLGPVGQFAVGNATVKITQTIDPDDPCKFNLGTADESNVQVTEAEATPSVTTRWGFDLGAGYRVMLTKSIDLVPRLGYQYMFTPYAADEDFLDNSLLVTEGSKPATSRDPFLNSLQLSLGLWFTR